MSRFSFDVVKSRVFPFTKTNDPDVVLGAAFGEDVTLTKVGGDILASHMDPIVGAVGNIGWLAVHVAWAWRSTHPDSQFLLSWLASRKRLGSTRWA